MWSDEQINDAISVLWNASEHGNVQKVVDLETEEKETYLVANDVTYTDPLYIDALEKLLATKRLVSLGKENDRELFGRKN